jgi:hypothetical protein
VSKKKIEKLLKAKGIKAETIEYQRGCPVPEGYASGWDLGFTEKTEDDVWNSDRECNFEMFMEFGSLKEVTDWIKTLPVIT